MASTLQDVLVEQSELHGLLDQLVVVHARALNEPPLNFRLETIRDDISVCLEDLVRMNESLIMTNGQLQTQLAVLRKSINQMKKLNRRFQSLTENIAFWSNSTPLEQDVKEDDLPGRVSKSFDYRQLFDQYRELQNIEEQARPTACVKDDDDMLRKSLSLLDALDLQTEETIMELKNTIQEIQKDRDFISREKHRIQALVNDKIVSANKELENIAYRQIEILNNVEYKLPDLPVKSKFEIPFFGTQAIGHLKLAKEINNVRTIEHIYEYIELKIDHLENELGRCKDRFCNLKEQQESWGKCVKLVRRLEDDLRIEIRRESSTLHMNILRLIQETMKCLEDMTKDRSNDLLKTLIGNELEVLQKACDEINNPS